MKLKLMQLFTKSVNRNKPVNPPLNKKKIERSQETARFVTLVMMQLLKIQLLVFLNIPKDYVIEYLRFFSIDIFILSQKLLVRILI